MNRALTATVTSLVLLSCEAALPSYQGEFEHHRIGPTDLFYLRDFTGTVTLEPDASFRQVELHVTLDDVELRALDRAGEVIRDWTTARSLSDDADPVALEGVLRLDRAAATLEVRARTPVEFGRLVTRDQDPFHEADLDDGVATEPRVARPGRWIPPAAVLSVANTQYLPYSGAPSSCSGTFRPGTRELAEFLKRSFAGATSYGGYACRANTANPGQLSVHASGRAIDLFVPLHGGAADNDKGDPIAHYLIKNAEALGIEYLVWDRTSWGAYRAAPKHREYTGPHPHHDHLHIEVSPAKANATGRSFPPVADAPACACVSGQTRTDACGNCGTRTRTCGQNCQWGQWGTCSGQGTCAPGAVQTRDCRDCGTQSRTCSSRCQWSDFDACEGPDPDSGNRACDTGELGPCADGRARCRSGYLACARLADPVAEVCDDIDNDCNGAVDDGSPTQLGGTPPRWGGELLDASWPRAVSPGDTAAVWADFRNVGSQTWEAGRVWLQAGSSLADEPSPLHDPATWPAWDVAAVVWEDVAPGATARLVFEMRVGNPAALDESFHLRAPGGELIGCPSPSFAITASPSGTGLELGPPPVGASTPLTPPTAVTPAPAHAIPSSIRGSGTACETARHGANDSPLALLLAAFLAAAHRRRIRPAGL